MLVLIIKHYLVLSLLRSNKIFFKEFLYCFNSLQLYIFSMNWVKNVVVVDSVERGSGDLDLRKNISFKIELKLQEAQNIRLHGHSLHFQKERFKVVRDLKTQFLPRFELFRNSYHILTAHKTLPRHCQWLYCYYGNRFRSWWQIRSPWN